MHQTTVRFSPDLWAQLEVEAERSGVSAAQYVRDATLARLAYTAGQRGDDPFGGSPADGGDPSTRSAEAVRVAREATEDSSAVWAQARLARERAQSVRIEAREVQTRSARKRAARPALPGR